MRNFIFVILALFISSCTATKIDAEMVNALAPVIVYKTKTDYNNKVPVILNETKDMISSYPAPSDLFYNGKLAIPSVLKKEYLLDRRGINQNTAFTSYTYEEYSSLKSAPTIQELYDSIIDNDPFLEIYNCGKMGDYDDLEKALKKHIRNGFKDCIRLNN